MVKIVTKYQISNMNLQKNQKAKVSNVEHPQLSKRVENTETLFDNSIRHLNLIESNLNIFKPFDNKKLNI